MFNKSVLEHFHDTMECILLLAFYCITHDWELVVSHMIQCFMLDFMNGACLGPWGFRKQKGLNDGDDEMITGSKFST
jgi:hypothetical protein